MYNVQFKSNQSCEGYNIPQRHIVEMKECVIYLYHVDWFLKLLFALPYNVELFTTHFLQPECNYLNKMLITFFILMRSSIINFQRWRCYVCVWVWSNQSRAVLVWLVAVRQPANIAGYVTLPIIPTHCAKAETFRLWISPLHNHPFFWQ